MLLANEQELLQTAGILEFSMSPQFKGVSCEQSYKVWNIVCKFAVVKYVENQWDFADMTTKFHR